MKGPSWALFAVGVIGFMLGVGISLFLLGSSSSVAVVLSAPWGMVGALVFVSGARGLSCGLAFWASIGLFVDLGSGAPLVSTAARRATLRLWELHPDIDPVGGFTLILAVIIGFSFHFMIRGGVFDKSLRNFLKRPVNPWPTSVLFGFGLFGCGALGYLEPISTDGLKTLIVAGVIGSAAILGGTMFDVVKNWLHREGEKLIRKEVDGRNSAELTATIPQAKFAPVVEDVGVSSFVAPQTTPAGQAARPADKSANVIDDNHVEMEDPAATSAPVEFLDEWPSDDIVDTWGRGESETSVYAQGAVLRNTILEPDQPRAFKSIREDIAERVAKLSRIAEASARANGESEASALDAKLRQREDESARRERAFSDHVSLVGATDLILSDEDDDSGDFDDDEEARKRVEAGNRLVELSRSVTASAPDSLIKRLITSALGVDPRTMATASEKDEKVAMIATLNNAGADIAAITQRMHEMIEGKIVAIGSETNRKSAAIAVNEAFSPQDRVSPYVRDSAREAAPEAVLATRSAPAKTQETPRVSVDAWRRLVDRLIRFEEARPMDDASYNAAVEGTVIDLNKASEDDHIVSSFVKSLHSYDGSRKTADLCANLAMVVMSVSLGELEDVKALALRYHLMTFAPNAYQTNDPRYLSLGDQIARLGFVILREHVDKALELARTIAVEGCFDVDAKERAEDLDQFVQKLQRIFPKAGGTVGDAPLLKAFSSSLSAARRKFEIEKKDVFEDISTISVDTADDAMLADRGKGVLMLRQRKPLEQSLIRKMARLAEALDNLNRTISSDLVMAPEDIGNHALYPNVRAIERELLLADGRLVGLFNDPANTDLMLNSLFSGAKSIVEQVRASRDAVMSWRNASEDLKRVVDAKQEDIDRLTASVAEARAHAAREEARLVELGKRDSLSRGVDAFVKAFGGGYFSQTSDPNSPVKLFYKMGSTESLAMAVIFVDGSGYGWIAKDAKSLACETLQMEMNLLELAKRAAVSGFLGNFKTVKVRVVVVNAVTLSKAGVEMIYRLDDLVLDSEKGALNRKKFLESKTDLGDVTRS